MSIVNPCFLKGSMSEDASSKAQGTKRKAQNLEEEEEKQTKRRKVDGDEKEEKKSSAPADDLSDPVCSHFVYALFSLLEI